MSENLKVPVPIQRLSAEFAAASLDREKRTADLVWYSGATVMRGGFFSEPHLLTLSMDPAHVRMGRLSGGKAPVLNAHSDFELQDIIGVVETAMIDGGLGKATIRFSAREQVKPIVQDVQDGIIRNASVGARIHKMKDVSKEDDAKKSYLAVDWEPLEISLVPIGADPNAGFQAGSKEEFTEAEIISADGCLQTAAFAAQEKTKMENLEGKRDSKAVANADAEEIRKIGLALKTEEAFTDGLISAGANLETARRAIIDRRAAISEGEPQVRSVHAEVTRDVADGLTGRMSDALHSRLTGKVPSDAAREWVGTRLSDMARELCVARGIRVMSRDAGSIIKLALSHSTSDFPNLLQGTGQRILLDGYRSAEAAIKRVCRRSTVVDFRAKAILRLGEAPKLLKVPESGEITSGTRAEAKESYRAFTYGRMFSISRESLVNDDLGAFGDFFAAFGQAAAAMEAQVLIDLLAANSGAGPTMEDTNPLFDATNHGNKATSGGAISDTTLGAARLALRTAKGLDAETIIEVAPRSLLVPAAIENTAEKYLALLYPAQASNVNPFAGGRLELLVEPRLDGVSATRWYLFGDPALAPVLEYSYLAGGPEGPQIEQRPGWDVLGIEFRAYEDFGAGAIGYRGAYANDGA